jgi:hypothetical protein
MIEMRPRAEAPDRQRGKRGDAGVVLAVLAAVWAALVATAGHTAGAQTVLPAQRVTSQAVANPAQAYSLLTSGGRLVGYGGAFSGSVPAPTSPVVGVASTPDGHGADAAEANGGVIPLGDAVFHGSMSGTALFRPVVGIATDPVADGYWLAASDGGIFTFGDARFYGSTGAVHLNRPVVGIAATPTGRGYWLVASDGGIFSFGDARFYGSTGAIHLNQPVIAMTATTSGSGYWLVASDGGIFTFGDARFYGSAANLNTRIVGMTAGAADNYGDPLRAVTGLTPMRVDEGVDYGGSGPIYALGDAVITSTAGSWPGGAFISYRLADGPAAGKMVYVAENLVATVSVGQFVTVNTVVGVLRNAYPYMEIGWAADQYGDTMAAGAGQWTASDDANSVPTAYGVNFDRLLVSLGAPSGIMLQPTVTGTLQAGWPTW